MYQPTKNAIGIVQKIVNVPHDLPLICSTEPAGSTTLSPTAASVAGFGKLTAKPSLRTNSLPLG